MVQCALLDRPTYPLSIQHTSQPHAQAFFSGRAFQGLRQCLLESFSHPVLSNPDSLFYLLTSIEVPFCWERWRGSSALRVAYTRQMNKDAFKNDSRFLMLW